MMGKRADHFIHTLFFTLTLIPGLGCATRDAGPGATTGEAFAPDVDQERAYIALTDLEPKIEKPTPPPDLKPVSGRTTKRITKAQGLISQQRYTEAAIELERALRYDPEHPRIHQTLAMLHWEAGNLERAATHARRAIEGDPSAASAYYVLGRCLARRKQYDKAITAYRTAQACGTFAGESKVGALCLFHLAKALAHERYLTSALNSLDRFRAAVSSIDGDTVDGELGTLLGGDTPPDLAIRSKILAKLGRYGDAADTLETLAHRTPIDRSIALQHATLLVQAERFDEALEAALNIPDFGEDVNDLLFDIHQRTGHPELIISHLRAFRLKSPDDPALVTMQAKMLGRLGRPARAKNVLQQFLARHADADAVRIALFDLLVTQKAWEDALHVAAAGLMQNPSIATQFESSIRQLGTNEAAITGLLEQRPPNESAESSYLRGIIAWEAGRLDLAEELLTIAHQRNPAKVSPRAALAWVYLRSYRYDDVLRVAARTNKTVPDDSRLELLLGTTHNRLDNHDLAELHYKAAIQLDRTNTEAMLALAKVYRKANKGLRARRQLNVLLEVDPDNDDARELLAESFFQEGKLDVSIAHIVELAKRTDNPLTRARCEAFVAHTRDPDLEAYRRVLSAAIEVHGGDAATWLALAESYDPDRETQLQRAALEKALSLEPDNEDARRGLVRVHRRRLAFEEAAEQLENLLKIRPRSSSRWLQLIDLYWILQKYDKALAKARTLESLPNLDKRMIWQVRRTIISTLRLAKRYDEAIEQVKRWAGAEQDEPTDEKIYTALLAEEYLRQDKPAKAVAILEKIADASPHDAVVQSSLIRALIAGDQHVRASQIALELLSRDPDNENSIFQLAQVLRNADRTDDALELLQSRLLHTLDRESVQNLYIGALANAERFDICVEYIESLLDEAGAVMQALQSGEQSDDSAPRSWEERVRQPNKPFTMERVHQRIVQLRDSLARVSITAKEFDTAADALIGWLESAISPQERFGYLSLLAVCHRGQGNEDKAAKVLTRALVLRPDNLTLNNDVAYGWIDRGTRLVEAERMIRYALSRQPRQSAFLDTYGWLLYKKGQWDESAKWLRRAQRARSTADVVILDHLGDALWRLGKTEQALEQWRLATENAEQRPEDDVISADEKRVRDTVGQKIEAAEKGAKPPVAPLAPASDSGDGKDDMKTRT